MVITRNQTIYTLSNLEKYYFGEAANLWLADIKQFRKLYTGFNGADKVDILSKTSEKDFQKTKNVGNEKKTFVIKNKTETILSLWVDYTGRAPDVCELKNFENNLHLLLWFSVLLLFLFILNTLTRKEIPFWSQYSFINKENFIFFHSDC